MNESPRKNSIQKWRKRGFYSESALVKKLVRQGYKAVRVPVSNPSSNPLPDIIARKGQHIYAFEVKKGKYYVYFPKKQIEKLFCFLEQMIPIQQQYKHAVLGAHFGRKWILSEINWNDWKKGQLSEQLRVKSTDRNNYRL